jgi:UDP-N-acetyl-D-mannosaminuronic acid dehydrogenase
LDTEEGFSMSLAVFATFGREEPVADRTISVIGLGYIGLPTAACFAQAGYRVIGVDISQRAVEAVNAGRTHIVEPGLEELIAGVVASGHLTAQTTPTQADAYLIAVPTPVGHDQYRTPDMRYVEAAAASIAPSLRQGSLVILESTSPVGTTTAMIAQLAGLRPDLTFPLPGCDPDAVDVDVVYSPERVIPGKTLAELRTNDRVVGGATPRASMRAAALYGKVTSGELLITNDRTAEFVKLAENAFRDVNIAFANEISMVCDDLAIDPWEVIALANRHPRVSILQPGPGVGGHCIAVDPWFIVAQAPERARLIRTAREVNDSKPHFVMDKARRALEENPDARLGCFGLTFKANVDDFRESPSLEIARTLSQEFPGRVFCTDPYHHLLSDTTNLTLCAQSDLNSRCDLHLLLVPHAAFFDQHQNRNAKFTLDVCGQLARKTKAPPLTHAH